MHQLCTRLNCVTSHYPYHKSVSAPRLPQEFASWGTQSLKGKGRRSLRVCHAVWCIMMYYDISSGSLMSLTYEQTDSWPDILSKKKGPMSNLYHHLQHGNTPKTSVGEGSYSTPLLTINLLCKHVYLSKFRVGGHVAPSYSICWCWCLFCARGWSWKKHSCLPPWWVFEAKTDRFAAPKMHGDEWCCSESLVRAASTQIAHCFNAFIRSFCTVWECPISSYSCTKINCERNENSLFTVITSVFVGNRDFVARKSWRINWRENRILVQGLCFPQRTFHYTVSLHMLWVFE